MTGHNNTGQITKKYIVHQMKIIFSLSKMHGYINVVVYKTEFWERCAPPLGIGEVHTSPKKPPHSLTISPKSGLGYMLTRFLHACHLISYLYFKVQMVIVAMHACVFSIGKCYYKD